MKTKNNRDSLGATTSTTTNKSTKKKEIIGCSSIDGRRREERDLIAALSRGAVHFATEMGKKVGEVIAARASFWCSITQKYLYEARRCAAGKTQLVRSVLCRVILVNSRSLAE